MLLYLRAISRKSFNTGERGMLQHNPVNDFQISNDKALKLVVLPQSPGYIQPILNSIKILVIV
jgi:hypothetical protein